MSTPIDLSIVVPVYQSALTLRELVPRLLAAGQELHRTTEVVLVDDGSPDSSWEVLGDLKRELGDVLVCVQLMRNYGQHNALMCGFRHARGRVIVTIDDDLQNPPEEIPKLIRRMEQGEVDVVYGIPGERRDPAWRRLGSNLIQAFVQKALGLSGPMSAFRAIRRPVVDAILLYGLNYTCVDGLLAWNTDRIQYVTVAHCARTTGRSGYSLRRLVFYAMNIVTNFSLLPLQMATAVGFLASMGGLLTGAYYLMQALLTQIAVPGYASTIVAVLVLGGLQLLALGVIGEYVGRLHLNVNRKPQYTVRQVLGQDQAGSTVPRAADSGQHRLQEGKE